MIMLVRRARFRIERRFERRHLLRPSRAASPPAHDRGGCGCGSPTICTSVWRLPRCQASRTKSRGEDGVISSKRFGLPAAPARSSRHRAASPSPSRNATGFSRSSRTCVPFSPVSTMRRRCRSSASSIDAVGDLRRVDLRLADYRSDAAHASPSPRLDMLRSDDLDLAVHEAFLADIAPGRHMRRLEMICRARRSRPSVRQTRPGPDRSRSGACRRKCSLSPCGFRRSLCARRRCRVERFSGRTRRVAMT